MTAEVIQLICIQLSVYLNSLLWPNFPAAVYYIYLLHADHGALVRQRTSISLIYSDWVTKHWHPKFFTFSSNNSLRMQWQQQEQQQ